MSSNLEMNSVPLEETEEGLKNPDVLHRWVRQYIKCMRKDGVDDGTS